MGDDAQQIETKHSQEKRSRRQQKTERNEHLSFSTNRIPPAAPAARLKAKEIEKHHWLFVSGRTLGKTFNNNRGCRKV